jgi:formylglycine-generating enzyme required for sulfatase activity
VLAAHRLRAIFVTIQAIGLILGVVLATSSYAQSAEKRVALVIGAENYTVAKRLVNPINDANAIAESLKAVGFQSVDVVLNPRTLAAFGEAVSAFEDKARDADVAIIYYAGHGVSVDGTNWLLPTEIDVARKQELRYEAISADDLVGAVRGASKVRLVILDACRNDPFSGLGNENSRSIGPSGGLSRVSTGNNVVVLMATSPGATASDGAGKPNSPFGAALAYLIRQPGMRLVTLPSEVSRYVQQMTLNTQRPDQQGIPDDPDWAFSPALVANGTSKATPSPVAAQPAFDGRQAELAFWNTCCAGPNATPSMFQAYLSKVSSGEFPGTFSAIARAQTEAGRGGIGAAPVAAPTARLPAAPGKLITTGTSVQTGQVFRDCANCPQMVALPGGSFTMGSPPTEANHFSNEAPQIEVAISGFAMGRYEVTLGEYAAFVKATNHKSDEGCFALDKAGNYNLDPKGSWKASGFTQSDNDPAVCISWDDASAYAAWLAKSTKQAYRLPTEAEWEYAARAGTTSAYYFGNDAANVCRFVNAEDAAAPATRSLDAACDDRFLFTAPVGSLGANRFKLSDMHGNVREWVSTCYGEALDAIAVTAKQDRDAFCSDRVLRGGSYNTPPGRTRSASRNAGDPTGRGNATGFRVAREITAAR